MKTPGKRSLRLGLLAVALAVVVGLGPRPPADTRVDPVSLSPDLEGYLATSEARYDDITPGAAKSIVWADSARPGVTPLSVVYLHGFSATRQELRPVTERVAKQLDANAFLTRLKGHGRSGEALADASMNDWIQDTAEALEIGSRIGRRVVLVGTSTGATLAVWAAVQDRWRDSLAALVLISPNFRPADFSARVLTWPWGGLIARAVVGDYREWEPHNEAQARYWTTRYPVEGVLPMAALVKTVSRLDLAEVQAPTLVIYSSSDQVVSVDAILAALDRLGGTPTRSLDLGVVGDPDNHVLAGDILSPESTDRTVEAIVDFVGSVSASR